MEIKLNVTVELGPNTLALIGLANGVATSPTPKKAVAKEEAVVDEAEEAPAAKPAPAKKAVAKPAPKMKVVEETEEEGEEEAAEEEAPKPVAKKASPAPAAKAAAPAPKAVAKPAPKAAPAKAVAFEDLDEEGQLEALKAHATKHTKKGKTADIKALVANYGADRVSDLDPEYYVEFNEVLTRYSDGESVEDIFPNVD